MKKAFWTVLCLLLAAAAGWLCRSVTGDGDFAVARQSQPTPKVTAVVVTNTLFNPVREYIGHVEPIQDVSVLPQVEGCITKVVFREGMDVREGDVLFEIDVDRYAATARLRRAEVEQAKAAVAQAEAALEKSARYLRRLRAVDGRGITQTELDAAETAEAADQAVLKSAKAGLGQAEARLALADLDVRRSKVVAPLSGRVGKAMRHVGDWVSPSGGALARLVQTDPMRVAFAVTDMDFMAWRVDAARNGVDIRSTRRLRLRLPDGSLYAAHGTWDFDDNEMDAATATIVVRLTFPNNDGLLVPNAYVRVLSDAAEPSCPLTVPETAVEIAGDGSVVWVIGPDGVVERRIVECSAPSCGRMAVVKGLESGERIVVRGIHKMFRGARPVIVEE